MLPDRIGQGCASLLPDQDRPALLWTIDVDDTGATTAARLERAMVRRRAGLTCGGFQAGLDAGRASEPLALLREIGERLVALSAHRGGVDLDLPSQDVVPDGHGGVTLAEDAPPPPPAARRGVERADLAAGGPRSGGHHGRRSHGDRAHGRAAAPGRPGPP